MATTSTISSDEKAKKQLDEIRFSEKILFWAERVQILELILFPDLGHVFPAFVPYLWTYIAIGINMFYTSTFIERQKIQPFSFEPDCVFYLERAGFLLVLLKSLGYMENGLDYGIDVLATTQLFLILELLVKEFRFLKKRLDEPENAELKAMVDNVISKISGWVVYAISPITNLTLAWKSFLEPVKSKTEREDKDENEAEKLNDLESDEEDESNSVEDNEDEEEVEELRKQVENHEAQRQSWEKEKSNLLQLMNHMQRQLKLPPPSPCYVTPISPYNKQWEGEKATLVNKIQNYETEKKELLEKHYKLIQEKGSIEVELGFQKSLAEQYKAGMEEFEKKCVEQSEKNLDLAGKLSAEFWMVKKLSSENDELKGKCRELEGERCELMGELVVSKTAYEHYFNNHTNSHPQ